MCQVEERERVELEITKKSLEMEVLNVQQYHQQLVRDAEDFELCKKEREAEMLRRAIETCNSAILAADKTNQDKVKSEAVKKVLELIPKL